MIRGTDPLQLFDRIDVQDRVKRLQKDPREDYRLEVEWLQRILTTDLILLQSLHSALNNTPSTVRNNVEDPLDESFEDFGDQDEKDNPSGQDQVLERNDPDLDLPSERVPRHLPSSHATVVPHHRFQHAH